MCHATMQVIICRNVMILKRIRNKGCGQNEKKMFRVVPKYARI